MFPSATAKRIRSALADAAETMLEVADAMLAPEVAFDTSDRAAAEDSAPYASTSAALGEPAPHPHRQPLRSDRSRRPGDTPAREQHCISPVTCGTTPRTPASAATAQSRAARA